jgi:hypothetical protein
VIDLGKPGKSMSKDYNSRFTTRNDRQDIFAGIAKSREIKKSAFMGIKSLNKVKDAGDKAEDTGDKAEDTGIKVNDTRDKVEDTGDKVEDKPDS